MRSCLQLSPTNLPRADPALVSIPLRTALYHACPSGAAQKRFSALRPDINRRKRRTRCQAASTILTETQASKQNSPPADQDLFLIAGAGIAGLAMAAALTKVSVPAP